MHRFPTSWLAMSWATISSCASIGLMLFSVTALLACADEGMPAQAVATKFFNENKSRFDSFAAEFRSSEFLMVQFNSGLEELEVRYDNPLREEVFSGPEKDRYRHYLDVLYLDRIERVNASSHIRLWPKGSLVGHEPTMYFFYMNTVAELTDIDDCEDDVELSLPGYCKVGLGESWVLYYNWR